MLRVTNTPNQDRSKQTDFPKKLIEKVTIGAKKLLDKWTSSQNLMTFSDIKALKKQFPKHADQELAKLILNRLASAGNYSSLNSLLICLRELGCNNTQKTPLLRLTSSSAPEMLQYLHNCSYFKSFRGIPFSKRMDQDYQLRIYDRSLMTYGEMRKKNFSGILILDSQLLRFAETEVGSKILAKIIKDPNVKLVKPIGYSYEVNALNWQTDKATMLINQIITGVRDWFPNIDLSVKNDTTRASSIIDLYLQKTDPWNVYLQKNFSPDEYANRLIEVQNQYLGNHSLANDVQVNDRPTLNELNFNQPIISYEQLCEILAKLDPQGLEKIVSLIDEHSHIYTWKNLQPLLKKINDQITARYSHYKIIYVTPERDKSFTLINYMYQQSNSIATEDFTHIENLPKLLKDLKARNPDKQVALVILDDLAASGETMYQAVLNTSRLGNFSAKDAEARANGQNHYDSKKDLFDGPIIACPLVCTGTAEKQIRQIKTNLKNKCNVDVIYGELITSFRECQTYLNSTAAEKLMLERILKQSTEGSLGFAEMGLMVVFPWGAPNNNASLWAQFAENFAHWEHVKTDFKHLKNGY